MIPQYEFPRDKEARDILDAIKEAEAAGRCFHGHVSGPPGYGKRLVLDAVEKTAKCQLLRLPPPTQGVPPDATAWNEAVFDPLARWSGKSAPGSEGVTRDMDDVLDAKKIIERIDSLISDGPGMPLVLLEDIEQLVPDRNFTADWTRKWATVANRFHLLTVSAFAWNQLASVPASYSLALQALPIPVSIWDADTTPARGVVDRALVDRWFEDRLAGAPTELAAWAGDRGNRAALIDACLRDGGGHPALVARLLARVVEEAATYRQVPAMLAAEKAEWPTNGALEERLLPFLASPENSPVALATRIADIAYTWHAAVRDGKALESPRADEAMALGLPTADQIGQAVGAAVSPDRVEPYLANLRNVIASRAAETANTLADEPAVKTLIAALQQHLSGSDGEDARNSKINTRSIRRISRLGEVDRFQLSVTQELLEDERPKVKTKPAHMGPRSRSKRDRPTFSSSLFVYSGLKPVARKLWVSQLATLRRLADAGLPAVRPISRGGSIEVEGAWAGYILAPSPPGTLASGLEPRDQLLVERDSIPAALPQSLCDLAEAVSHLHDLGSLHRQIDLAHIGVMTAEGRDGLPKLTLEGFDQSMLLRAVLSGLPPYDDVKDMEPMERLFIPLEAQALGPVTTATRQVLRWAHADVYAFGVLAAILTAGAPPLHELTAIFDEVDLKTNDGAAKTNKLGKIRDLLIGLRGWKEGADEVARSAAWRSYLDMIREIVMKMIGDSASRPSMQVVFQRLRFASNEYRKAFQTDNKNFAVVYSPSHMMTNLPRHLLGRDLDLGLPVDQAFLKERIAGWIEEAEEIQYAPDGFVLARSAASETVKRSTVMIIGPEVVFFASYQNDQSGRHQDHRLLRLNFTIYSGFASSAPIPEDSRVKWPANVRVFAATELDDDAVKATVADCASWSPLVDRAEAAISALPEEAALAVAVWRFHLRMLRVHRDLREFPVIVTRMADSNIRLVLDHLAFDKILSGAMHRMVFGAGQPGTFFANELTRWRDELTAGSGKLQFRDPVTKRQFDLDIVGIGDGQITVRTQYQRTWPPQGVLYFAEDDGTKAAERRQHEGIARLTGNNRVFRHIVAAQQSSIFRFQPFRSPPSMKQALEVLKSSWPVSAVNGPPGTGKTSLLANLVREILEDDPAARILLTSQSHAAVDNALERIGEELAQTPSHLMIRAYSAFTKEKVSENSLRNHDIGVLVKNARGQVVDSMKLEKNSSENHYLKSARDILLRAALSKSNEWARRIERSAPLVAATTSSASQSSEYLRTKNDKWDWVLCDEAGRAFGIEIASALGMAQRVVMTGDYKQLPPYRIEDIEAAILAIGRRVSAGKVENLTIDMLKIGASEKSLEKAIAWLVPFKRLMNLEVPFQPDVGKSIPGILPVTMQLAKQYRSLKPIGDLVSNSFYEGTTRTDEGRYAIPAEPVLKLGDEPHDPVLCWVDTGSIDSRWEESAAGISLRNRFEAQVAADLAIRVFKALENDDPESLRDPKKLSEMVRILTPYAAQVRQIRAELDKTFPPDKADPRKVHEAIMATVGTVDSSQGAEARLCIYSWVRSRPNPRIPAKNSPVQAWEAALRGQFGFLLARERMNVLMSRARDQIIIVGDRSHFNHFRTLHEGLVNAIRQAPGEKRIDPDQISFWSALLDAFDPDKNWEHGRRVIPYAALGIRP